MGKCPKHNSEHICDRDDWDAHVVYMEENSPGFWDIYKLRAMYELRTRTRNHYRFGYEIQGYGTVVGYCGHHEPHPTEQSALECGRRFLNGEPELLRDRWRRARKRKR